MALSATERKQKQRANLKKSGKVRLELVVTPAQAKLIKEYAQSLATKSLY